MIYKVHGNAIKNYVTTNGITAEEFCDKFDLPTNTYKNIMAGKKVKLTTLFVLSQKMHLSLNSFLA
ncbi:MAG: hypothetical protein J5911_04735 [Clostridia bacterium]|nr:hypothetical protein [Clostridia bacterium]